jgi:SM-20-related protein
MELSGGVDGAALAREFARSQVIQIPAVLAPALADQLHRALCQETSWTLAHNIDETHRRVPDLAPADRMKLAIQSRARARDHFAFFHDSHELSREGEPYARPDHTFAALVSLLNGPEFMRFVRQVTGMDEIRLADATAKLFRPGDYLTRRDSTAVGGNRLAAYELSMTPAWNLDWGGILSFVNASGHVGRGYVPTFNTLTLFSSSSVHFVSQVALQGGLRYSVSGWLRSSA